MWFFKFIFWLLRLIWNAFDRAWNGPKRDKGYIYLIENKRAACVKIGYSHNPARRLQQLSTGSADPLRLAAVIQGTYQEEQRLHAMFQIYHSKDEWFRDCRAIRMYFQGRSIPWWKWWIIGLVTLTLLCLYVIGELHLV